MAGRGSFRDVNSLGWPWRGPDHATDRVSQGLPSGGRCAEVRTQSLCHPQGNWLHFSQLQTSAETTQQRFVKGLGDKIRVITTNRQLCKLIYRTHGSAKSPLLSLLVAHVMTLRPHTGARGSDTRAGCPLVSRRYSPGRRLQYREPGHRPREPQQRHSSVALSHTGWNTGCQVTSFRSLVSFEGLSHMLTSRPNPLSHSIIVTVHTARRVWEKSVYNTRTHVPI